MTDKNKVYGLILSNKATKAKSNLSRTSNVFGDDSDEEEKASGPVAPYSIGSGPSKMKRQAQMDIDKALKEDPNIYEYDEVYEEMQANKPTVGHKATDKESKDRKPKYITGLLKAAEVKKKEEERRKERQVQKEREAEGEKYADKEKFVTSAYKQKMLEMQEAEEKERREAAMEALTDVTKQKDMSGFYRYLYRNAAGNEDVKEAVEGKRKTEDAPVKEEPASPERSRSPKTDGRRRSSSSSSSNSSKSYHSGAENAQDKRKDSVKFSKPKIGGSNIRRSRMDTDSDSDGGKRPDENRFQERKRKKSPTTGARSRSPRSVSPVESKKRKDERTERQNRRQDSKSRSRSVSPKRSEASASRNDRSRRRRSASVEDDDRRGKVDRPTNRPSSSRKSTADDRGRNGRSISGSPPVNEKKKLKPNSRNKENKPETSDPEESEDTELPEVSRNLKAIRDGTEKSREPNEMTTANAKNPAKPVDPAKKVYPHHNSAKDIAEARKRYLERKLARARGEVA